MLADFGTQLILFMVYFAILAKNPMEKIFWFGSVATTIIAILATANRGATSGLILAFILALVFFRRRLGGARIAVIVIGAAVGLVVLDTVLSEKTLAVSVIGSIYQHQVPKAWCRRIVCGHVGPDDARGFGKAVLRARAVLRHRLGIDQAHVAAQRLPVLLLYSRIVRVLTFLWVIARVYRESRMWRARGVRDTRLGTFMAIAQIWLFVLLLEQMRTDHQRDDIYPYIVWMCFGVIVAGAAIARRKLAADESHFADGDGVDAVGDVEEVVEVCEVAVGIAAVGQHRELGPEVRRSRRCETCSPGSSTSTTSPRSPARKSRSISSSSR